MSKKPIPLKITFLGDDSTVITNFINEYSKDHNPKEETKKGVNYKIIRKILAGEEFKISMSQINETENRSKVGDADCVIIFFDMSKRKSFENLLDIWLIWLRDTIQFKGLIFIFGDYNPNNILLTDQAEVQELIEVSQVPATFLEIGCLDKKKKIAGFEDFMIKAYNEGVKKGNKGCNIF